MNNSFTKEHEDREVSIAWEKYPTPISISKRPFLFQYLKVLVTSFFAPFIKSNRTNATSDLLIELDILSLPRNGRG